MAARQTYQVQGHDIDPQYRLKSHHIASYFQDSVARYFADIKLAAFDLQEDGRSWVLSEMKIEYVSGMPRWRSDICVDTWASSIGRVRLGIDFIARSSDDREIARGTSKWLIIDEMSRRPQRLDEYKHRIQLSSTEILPGYRFPSFPQPAEEELPVLSPELSRIPYRPEQRIWRLQQSIRSYDIDFNGHLSNIRYIAGAVETIPCEYRLDSEPAFFEVKYLREALLDQQIDSICYRTVDADSALSGSCHPGFDGDVFFHILRDKTSLEHVCHMVSGWH